MTWADGKQRCRWANPHNERYVRYHDEVWGIAVHDDRKLFEMLILESFQAGLSWECILNKQGAFERAFDGFDLEKVCAYGEEKLAALQNNPDIVRVFREIQRECGHFSRYLWRWTDGAVVYERGKTSSPLSDALSEDLKKRGMTFVGTTIIYAYLQAVGVIWSHDEGCFLEYIGR